MNNIFTYLFVGSLFVIMVLVVGVVFNLRDMPHNTIPKDVVEIKRISPSTANGVYYFEYQGNKFILTAQGYVTQIFNQE